MELVLVFDRDTDVELVTFWVDFWWLVVAAEEAGAEGPVPAVREAAPLGLVAKLTLRLLPGPPLRVLVKGASISEFTSLEGFTPKLFSVLKTSFLRDEVEAEETAGGTPVPILPPALKPLLLLLLLLLVDRAEVLDSPKLSSRSKSS